MLVTREQALAFRVARQGLTARRSETLAGAAVVPVSDFARGSAAVALAARCRGVTRAAYTRAVDAGDLVVAYGLRGALHAVAPADVGRFGRALLARDDDGELTEQLGQQMARVLAEHGLSARGALEEVAEVTWEALAGGAALTKDELHAALRARVRPELMPWCAGCGSHHVAPMLWRYAGVEAGVRCDAERRFLLDPPASAPADGAEVEAARRFLRAYAPAKVQDLAAWGGLARAQARRLWAALVGELVRVEVEGRAGLPVFALAEDADVLASPPRAGGLRLLPDRDPLLQHPDRSWLTPDPALRKRLHRPTAGPGAVLQDGALAGLWRGRAKGKRLHVSVEAIGALDEEALKVEADAVAALRGAEAAVVTVAAGASAP